MSRIKGLLLGAACAASILAVLPAASAARTQIVWAGGPPKFQSTLQHDYSAEANDFFPRSVTIHVGDTISWEGMAIGFHTIDLPGQSGADLPLVVPNGQTTTDEIGRAHV